MNEYKEQYAQLKFGKGAINLLVGRVIDGENKDIAYIGGSNQAPIAIDIKNEDGSENNEGFKGIPIDMVFDSLEDLDIFIESLTKARGWINAEGVKGTETKSLKVVCITNDFRELERYATYKVLNEQQGFYEILNDEGEVAIYEKKYFKEVKENLS